MGIYWLWIYRDIYLGFIGIYEDNGKEHGRHWYLGVMYFNDRHHDS